MKIWPKQLSKSNNNINWRRLRRLQFIWAVHGKIAMLRRTSQFAAVVLVVAVIAAPVMACMVPYRQMTAEEQTCCKKMAHQCESAVMPNSHSCCQHPVSRHPASVTTVCIADIGFSTATLTQIWCSPAVQTNPRLAYAFESPPESPLKISSILRI